MCIRDSPLGLFYGAIQEGVYKDQQDFDSSPKHSSSQVGTIKFKDLNGDGKITMPEDYTEIGNPWPKFTLGFTNDFSYKAFNLSVVVVGSYGNQILSFYENWVTNLDGVFNVLEEVKDRWKSPQDPGKGLYGSTQAGTTFLERDRWHSRFVKDGSYLSLRTISLSYNVPLKGNKYIYFVGPFVGATTSATYSGVYLSNIKIDGGYHSGNNRQYLLTNSASYSNPTTLSAIDCNSIKLGVPIFLVNKELTNKGVFLMLFFRVSI